MGFNILLRELIHYFWTRPNIFPLLLLPLKWLTIFQVITLYFAITIYHSAQMFIFSNELEPKKVTEKPPTGTTTGGRKTPMSDVYRCETLAGNVSEMFNFW